MCVNHSLVSTNCPLVSINRASTPLPPRPSPLQLVGEEGSKISEKSLLGGVSEKFILVGGGEGVILLGVGGSCNFEVKIKTA